MKQNRATSKIVGIVLVCLVIGSILGGLLGTLNTSVNAAPLTYDKDTILCNYDFDFTNTLSEEEIQNIFESRNSFFKDYIDPTTSKRASWVVADRAQYYQISSRVLLAKMQHESSSVWAYKDMNEHIYNEAGIDMGTRADWVLFYGWSDTTIYPQYKGFYNQVDNAAKSLSEWFADPSSKGWEVGKPHAVSDGTVTPTNKVTCALYIYTPWIGDTEPPSGNKLLYQVWKMMFGDTGVCSRTWYVDDDLADYPGADFTKIQDAVDAASAGDTIIVYPGTYTENVDVNKDHLIIQSENGADSTIVQAANSDDHVFEVTADYVEITGFTVEEATGSDKAGIYLDNADHCEISNNIILNNKHGIHLNDSSFNDIDDNTVKLCSGSGIFLDYSPISGLYLPAVGYNVKEDDPGNPWEDEPLAYDGDTDTFAKSQVIHNNGTAWLELFPPTEKSLGIRFWIDIGSQRSFFRVEIFYDESWHCLRNWNFPYSPAPKGEWVILDYPEGERSVEKARVKFHAAGISGYKPVYLSEFQFKTALDISCSNNDIIGNTVSNNGVGIRLYRSSDNRIYLNNFINNTDNGYSTGSSNICNSPEEITYTYNGNTYTSYLGNYWSDYGTYLPPVGHNDPGDQWKDEVLAYDENRDTYARVYLSGGRGSSPLELLAPPGKPTEGIRFWGSGGPLWVDIYYEGGWHSLKNWPWGISSAPSNEWVELTYPSKIVERARIGFHGRVLSGWSYLHEFQFKTAPADYSRSDADGDGIGDTPYSIDSDKDNYPLMEPLENYEIGPANQPPVADAEPDYAYILSGTLITFNGSNSCDPDGALVSYEWDFGDGETATGCHVDHRFRGAMNEPKNYDVTLIVQDNMGAIDKDTVTITVTPLEKTVPLSSESGEVFAQMTAFYNWVQVIEGKDIYVVSKIDFEGERFSNYLLLVWDEYNFPVAFPAWTWGTPLGILMPVSETFAYPFGTYRDWADTVGNEYFEGLAVCSGDRMELHAFSVELAIPELEMTLSWEGAYCYFDPSSHEVFPSTGPILWSIIGSSAELRVYDSEGRVAGLVNGEVKEEIPYSTYGENIVMVLPSYDSYIYEIEGTGEGSYGLGVASVEDGETTTFTATDIPTSGNATHEYTFDWDALSQGEEGATVQIDSDGDGIFEQTITSDNELTHDEFILQTATTVDFDPDTLNLKSKGKYVTVYIELPPDYDVGQIDVSSVMLNEVVPALTKPTEVGDYDGDGIPDLMVKFNRAAVQEILTQGDQVEITISGEVAGIGFEGDDTIRVIDR